MLVSAKWWCVVTSAALLLWSAGEAHGQGGMLAWDHSDPNMLTRGYSVSVDGHSTDYGVSPVGAQGAGACGCAISLPFSGGRHTIVVTAYGAFGQIHSAPLDVAPVAKAGGPYAGQVGLAVSFNGGNSTSPNGWITQYSWQWGDGTNTTSSSSPTTSHVFSSTGTFNVTLTTTDNAGATASSTVAAVITSAAPPSTPGSVVLSVTPSSIQLNGSNQITWSGIPSPTARDWIGIFNPTAPNTSDSGWMYVSCSQSPSTPRASGSCSMPTNLPAGTYQLRLFANDGYTSLITDPTKLPSFTVGAVTPPPTPPPPAPPTTTLTATPASVGTGGTIQVTWSGIPSPTAGDWIGIFNPTAPNTSDRGWMYVSCSQNPSTPRASGSCSMPINLPAGTYQLRLFANDGHTSLITDPTKLPSFTVGAVTPPPTPPPPTTTLTATPTSVRRGETIQIAWSGIASPSARDWIGIFDPNAPNTSNRDWTYVSCTQTPSAPRASGSCAAPMTLPAGTYQLRLFSNDSLTSLITNSAQLPSITVTP